MQTVVVFDKKTKEIIACVPTTDGETAICRKDVDFQIYNGTEPILQKQAKALF